MKRFEEMKYGLFIHCVYPLTSYADGSLPASVSDLAERFDVPAFADSVAATGAEYVVFTAWHYQMHPLYPSPVTERIRPGCSARRDLLGEIIGALAERNVATVLYTHPRDGHDLTGEARTATGWGAGHMPGREDTPSPETFDYEKWNAYALGLYRELAERYAGRIIGFYTDGVGPTFGRSPLMGRNLQIVDYPAIRDIMKSANENLVMIQNYSGYLYSNDIAMPEAFFGYEEQVRFDPLRLPAPVDSAAFCPFDGWLPPAAPRNAAPLKMPPRAIALYTLFAGSAADAGGVCWACGPYAEGGVWQPGVMETLRETGRLLAPYLPFFSGARRSAYYPTLPGDTLAGKAGAFFARAAEGEREYLFVTAPAGDRLVFPRPENGGGLSAPEVVLGDLQITAFTETDEGYELRLSGAPGELPAVIAFRAPLPPRAERWINDTDRRIRYEGAWRYCRLKAEDDSPLGCYESDYHVSEERESAAFLAFEGDSVEVYANRRPGNGSAAVFIDGVFSGTAATDGAAAVRTRVFRSRPLHGGTHTVFLEITGDAPFELDAFRVLSSDS